MTYTKSAIRGAALTLPSVEGGFGTLNILRDPPKSIHTKYKPKVGETSDITLLVDSSGDRICEGINKYARGINPMVSVSYSNNGTNGGQTRDAWGASRTTGVSSGSAYPPHQIARNGDFRPPIVPPHQTLPLSRQPILPYTYETNWGSEMMVVEDLTRCSVDMSKIREELMNICTVATTTFNMEEPIKCTKDVLDKVVDKCTILVDTNKNDSNRYVVGINKPPERGIHDTKVYSSTNINPGDKSGEKDLRNDRPDKRLTDKTYTPVETNIMDKRSEITIRNDKPTRDIPNKTYTESVPRPTQNTTEKVIEDRTFKFTNPKYVVSEQKTNVYNGNTTQNLNDVKGLQHLPVQDRVHTHFTINNRGTEKTDYVHNLRHLEKKQPMTEIMVNRTNQNVDINNNVMSRVYKLPDSQQLGSFTNTGTMTSSNRSNVPVRLKEESVYSRAAKNSLIAQQSQYNY